MTRNQLVALIEMMYPSWEAAVDDSGKPVVNRLWYPYYEFGNLEVSAPLLELHERDVADYDGVISSEVVAGLRTWRQLRRLSKLALSTFIVGNWSKYWEHCYARRVPIGGAEKQLFLEAKAFLVDCGVDVSIVATGKVS